MRKFVFVLLFILSIQAARSQDYIKVAVTECCDCFTNSTSQNQDSLLIACTISATMHNFAGLVSDLELQNLKDRDAQKVLSDRMIKYFKKCKSIKKYFKKNSGSYRPSKN